MIHLQPNQAVQRFYTNPFSSRKNFDDEVLSYLLVFESVQSGKQHIGVGVVEIDNERYTRFLIGTHHPPFYITATGQYTLTVYGQTSLDNTRVDDPSVLGVMCRDVVDVAAETAWTQPELSIPNNVVYYE